MRLFTFFFFFFFGFGLSGSKQFIDQLDVNYTYYKLILSENICLNMNTVLQATIYRIKTFKDDIHQLQDDLNYTINNISKQETKAALIQDKFIQTCFHLCSDESLSPTHIVQIVQIIQKLVVLYSARNIIISIEKQSYIPNIIQLLKFDDNNVKYNACKLVSTICFFEDSINAVSNSE
eukprot:261594_1